VMSSLNFLPVGLVSVRGAAAAAWQVN